MRLQLPLLAALLLFPPLPGSAASMQPQDLQVLIDAADPGSVITLPAGTYAGGVSVAKPITITGDGWPVIDGGEPRCGHRRAGDP